MSEQPSADERVAALEMLVYRWLLNYCDGECSDEQKLYADSYNTLGLPERMPELKRKLLHLPAEVKS